MKEECKQKILLAYAIGDLFLQKWAIQGLCERYGTEFVAECIVSLGLDKTDSAKLCEEMVSEVYGDYMCGGENYAAWNRANTLFGKEACSAAWDKMTGRK